MPKSWAAMNYPHITPNLLKKLRHKMHLPALSSSASDKNGGGLLEASESREFSSNVLNFLTDSITLCAICCVGKDLGGTVSNCACIVTAALAFRAFISTSFAFAIFPASFSIAVKVHKVTRISYGTSTQALKHIAKCLADVVCS